MLGQVCDFLVEMEVGSLCREFKVILDNGIANSCEKVVLQFVSPDAQAKETALLGLSVQVLHHFLWIFSYHQPTIADDAIKQLPFLN